MNADEKRTLQLASELRTATCILNDAKVMVERVSETMKRRGDELAEASARFIRADRAMREHLFPEGKPVANYHRADDGV